MQKRERFYVVAHEADGQALQNLSDNIAVILLDDGGEILPGSQNDLRNADQVAVDAIGAFALSDATHAKLQMPAAKERLARLGLDRVHVVAETGKSDQKLALAATLCACLIDARTDAIDRNIAAQRALSMLRRELAETQEAFARLERFMEASGGAARKLSVALTSIPARHAVQIADGDMVLQRLPGSSVGLTDVAIFIADELPVGDGMLTCTLETVEDGVVHGVWTIAAAELAEGWLRLALPVALGSDARTPALRCQWAGDMPLLLETACTQPDSRYALAINADVGTETLALKAWNFVAGCAVPLTVDGRAIDKRMGQRVRLPLEAYLDAFNLTPENEFFFFREEHQGLLLHPMSEGISMGVLKGVVLKGVRRVIIDIGTKHGQGPMIEYAAAVSASGKRKAGKVHLSSFDKEHRAAWQAVEPGQDSQIHLEFSEPVDAPFDIYLMTRLKVPSPKIDFAWSVFSNIVFEF